MTEEATTPQRLRPPPGAAPAPRVGSVAQPHHDTPARDELGRKKAGRHRAPGLHMLRRIRYGVVNCGVVNHRKMRDTVAGYGSVFQYVSKSTMNFASWPRVNGLVGQ